MNLFDSTRTLIKYPVPPDIWLYHAVIFQPEVMQADSFRHEIGHLGKIGHESSQGYEFSKARDHFSGP